MYCHMLTSRGFTRHQVSFRCVFLLYYTLRLLTAKSQPLKRLAVLASGEVVHGEGSARFVPVLAATFTPLLPQFLHLYHVL